jgi:hypothetical protein
MPCLDQPPHIRTARTIRSRWVGPISLNVRHSVGSEATGLPRTRNSSRAAPEGSSQFSSHSCLFTTVRVTPVPNRRPVVGHSVTALVRCRAELENERKSSLPGPGASRSTSRDLGNNRMMTSARLRMTLILRCHSMGSLYAALAVT